MAIRAFDRGMPSVRPNIEKSDISGIGAGFGEESRMMKELAQDTKETTSTAMWVEISSTGGASFTEDENYKTLSNQLSELTHDPEYKNDPEKYHKRGAQLIEGGQHTLSSFQKGGATKSLYNQLNAQALGLRASIRNAELEKGQKDAKEKFYSNVSNATLTLPANLSGEEIRKQSDAFIKQNEPLLVSETAYDKRRALDSVRMAFEDHAFVANFVAPPSIKGGKEYPENLEVDTIKMMQSKEYMNSTPSRRNHLSQIADERVRAIEQSGLAPHLKDQQLMLDFKATVMKKYAENRGDPRKMLELQQSFANQVTSGKLPAGSDRILSEVGRRFGLKTTFDGIHTSPSALSKLMAEKGYTTEDLDRMVADGHIKKTVADDAVKMFEARKYEVSKGIELAFSRETGFSLYQKPAEKDKGTGGANVERAREATEDFLSQNMSILLNGTPEQKEQLTVKAAELVRSINQQGDSKNYERVKKYVKGLLNKYFKSK